MPVMFHVVILSLLGFASLVTVKEHLICKSTSLELWSKLCDEKNHPTVSVEPCVRHTKVNISITWIPRMDLHRLYVVASIWHESRKITKYKYDLCSGTDDEFEFCGVLKGDETIPPTFSMNPCTIDLQTKMTISGTWIPRADLHRVSAVVSIWHKSTKFSEYKYIICSGADDEYEICGLLKGETARINMVYDMEKLSLPQSSYILHFQIFAGEKEELIFCFNISLITK
ncbi:lymphocyte antigen 96 isoform X1 [Ascaphus truei]|uniref:lymphocyte antigen 96 isoform X1 n=1 Tax=Ascaphus truei TaxID=8439 RepID=UPI003F5A46C0